MVYPHDIVREARALTGVPWRHMGRTRAGLDCFGLVLLGAGNAGVDLAACGVNIPRRYGRVAAAQVYAEVARVCTPCAPREGALVLFQFPGNNYPRHLGILSGEETVIHAEALVHRKVIEHGFRSTWLAQSAGCWLIPGVRYE